MALFGLLDPPDIPEPPKPRDFTAREREYLRGVVQDGDPLRDERDKAALDRLLSNSSSDMVGPTAATTLALRSAEGDREQEMVSDYMQRSNLLEERKVERSEQRLGQLEAERERDLDEYEQLKTAAEAQEEVMESNFESGLLRAGVNLAGTAVDFFAPGAGTALKTVGNAAIGDQKQTAEIYETLSYDLPEVDELAPIKFSDYLGPGANDDIASSQNMDPEDWMPYDGFNPLFPENYDPLTELSSKGLF